MLGDDRQISTKETEVQNLLDEYLPEYMHTQFDVKVEAGKLRNIGGYKNFLWEEYDLYLRYLKKTRKIFRIKKYLYF